MGDSHQSKPHGKQAAGGKKISHIFLWPFDFAVFA